MGCFGIPFLSALQTPQQPMLSLLNPIYKPVSVVLFCGICDKFCMKTFVTLYCAELFNRI